MVSDKARDLNPGLCNKLSRSLPTKLADTFNLLKFIHILMYLIYFYVNGHLCSCCLIQPKCNSADNERTGINLRSTSSEAKLDESNAPNESESSGLSKLSEDILRCLMNIFSRMSSPGNTKELLEASPSVSGSSGSSEETDSLDPYGICEEFGIRDIGPYKYFRAVEASSNFPNLPMGCSFLTWRLK